MTLADGSALDLASTLESASVDSAEAVGEAIRYLGAGR